MVLEIAVLDALKSLEIARLPPQVIVGERVDLGLTPPGLTAFDLLFKPPTLFDIELNNITLDNIAIDLNDINLSPVDASGEEKFQLTLDASNLDGSAPGTTDLKLREPVNGLLSQITGTAGQVEKFSGGITGTIGGHVKGKIIGTINNLKGSVKAPQLSKSEVRAEVEWYIKDENGKRLTQDTDFVLLNKTMTDPAPSLMFLPVFADLSAGVELISHRRISCKVTVTVGADKEYRLLGPVDILLPKIQLPTVLVMTEHATGVNYPGEVLVAVPSQSLLTLDQLTGKLGEVAVDLDRLKTISQVVGFGDTIDKINQIIGLISNRSFSIPRFVKADEVNDLWDVKRPGKLWFFTWKGFISSLVMIGPPGRGARFCIKTDLLVDDGAFQIILGGKGVGYIDNLTPTNPVCKPIGTGGCTFSHLLGQDIVLPSTFNDKISSYRFLPVQ